MGVSLERTTRQDLPAASKSPGKRVEQPGASQWRWAMGIDARYLVALEDRVPKPRARGRGRGGGATRLWSAEGAGCRGLQAEADAIRRAWAPVRASGRVESSGGGSGGQVGRVRLRVRRKEKEDSRSRVMHGANGQSAVTRQDDTDAAEGWHNNRGALVSYLFALLEKPTMKEDVACLSAPR